jgi:ABC-type branched-subunit amino acid transport system substrate-binding protein
MKRFLACFGCFPLALLMAGCSSPELDGTNFSCLTNADCGSGQVCASLNGALACQGTDDTSPIRIGMVGPLEGPSEDLGKEMSRGIEAMLKRFNAEGGVYGREVRLEKRNDNYDPDTAVEMTRQLLDIQSVVDDPYRADERGTNSVFALVGNIGTPTMLATAPVATKNKVVFFGPFTGAQAYLRDDTKSPYVYNYRAGYFDETAAMVEYIYRGLIPSVISDPATDYQRVLVFMQDDTYGEAGYQGVVAAYNEGVARLPRPDAIQSVRYTRENVESVTPAIQQAGTFLEGVLARAASADSVEQVAIIMIDTYRPGDAFIRGLKNWVNEDAIRAARLDLLFLNVSFVGSDSLAEALIATPKSYTDVATGATRAYAEKVIVTQVVPDYDSQAAGVAQYREDIREFDSGNHTFTSLEGYVVARLFTEALKLNGPILTSENFVKTLDSQIRNLDIGIGTVLNFTATNHQASYTVWGSQILEDGSFDVPFVWDRASGLE